MLNLVTGVPLKTFIIFFYKLYYLNHLFGKAFNNVITSYVLIFLLTGIRTRTNFRGVKTS